MNRKPLAVSLWVAAVVFTVGGVALSLAAGVVDLEHLIGLLWLAMASLGAVISIRVPGNPIGWLLLGVGVLFGVGSLAAAYADLAILAGTGSHSVGIYSAWFSHVQWVPVTFVPLTVVLLLFPNGRLLSRRWRPVMWASVLSMAVTTVLIGLTPDQGGMPPRWPVDNPFALDEDSPVLGVLASGFFLTLLTMIAAALSLLVRFRRASGVERQQLKWVVYGGGLAVPLWIVGGVGLDESAIGGIVATVAFPLFITSIAVAILRYRLYDIDRLISRTFSYAVVAGTLVGVFAGTVLVLSNLLPLEGDLAVAAATLAVAALFTPLRKRVQDRVDRRFNRSRYDAEREIERFAGRLRAELDLDALNLELVEVTARTMQPATTSVWIREER